jgi:hypothetical protein
MTSELVAWINEQPDLPSDDWLMILLYFVGQDPTCPPKKPEFHRPRPGSLPEVTMPRHHKAAAAAPAQPLDVERARWVKEVNFMQLLVSKSLGACSFFGLLEELCQSDSVVFEVFHKNVSEELKQIILELRGQEEEHKRLKDELEKLEAEIDVLETKDIELKPMKCARCSQRLALPYVAFFCRHNLHDTCCSEEDGHVTCPLCKYGSSPRYSVPADEHEQQKLEILPEADILDSIVRLIQVGQFS